MVAARSLSRGALVVLLVTAEWRDRPRQLELRDRRSNA